ncbi:MAG: hypothetical protein ACREBU_00455 [Nitrososphaera sp.]
MALTLPITSIVNDARKYGQLPLSLLDRQFAAVATNRMDFAVNPRLTLWMRDPRDLAAAVGLRRGSPAGWRINGTGTTISAARIAATIDQFSAFVKDNQPFHAQHVVSSAAAAANFARVEQCISPVKTYSNRTLTISLIAWATAASKRLAVSVSQEFGTGGAPSAAVNTASINPFVTLTTSPAIYSFVVNVPSVTGKTFGTDAGSSFMVVRIWLDAGADHDAQTGTMGQQSGTINIARLKIEEGDVFSEFLPGNLELDHWQTDQYETLTFTQAVAAVGASGFGQMAFRRPMLTDPTAVFTAFTGGTGATFATRPLASTLPPGLDDTDDTPSFAGFRQNANHGSDQGACIVWATNY